MSTAVTVTLCARMESTPYNMRNHRVGSRVMANHGGNKWEVSSVPTPAFYVVGKILVTAILLTVAF